ncbi:O-antigen/teichoic acid export membrane protein [Microbacterium proteolyticum]|uniref:O-antigen/teichoic acid export membrane protein n=1 Tax=Microbacterium proteolyticum TaxID=1572644 RepID=A0A7W5GGH3_9MICO|nr:oligosaccharide flippase family protein [Microbacterium proteolyticum]MBB3158603.1 O-antigen/teichoic acid export membrane protein [Microbacterium proteolyticum]
MLRGVLRLSIGTAVARAMAAVGQLLLAVWLTPTDFGYWAAATSVISVLTGLANFGEVNGYLSGQGGTFSQARRAILRVNTVLAGSGALIAVLYWLDGNVMVAALAAISAVSIPLIGDAELMYSTGVKYKAYARVVTAQIFAAVAKIIVGVVIAAAFASPLAFAVSTVVFYLLMDIVILRRVPSLTHAEVESVRTVSPRTRFTWGVNSLFVTLPIQVGFIVAQFGASAEVLGLYFLAYQVSLGLSGLVSVPLARVALSSLSNETFDRRVPLSMELCRLFVFAVSGLAALVSLFAPLIGSVLGAEWTAAAPAVVILLASLAVRMMSPILDGLQQANNRWWQGTAFNAVDTAGTAAAALVSFTGDLMLLVSAVAMWKVLFGLVRAAWLLSSARPLPVMATLLPALVMSLLIGGSAFFAQPASIVVLVCALIISVGGTLLTARARRSRP